MIVTIIILIITVTSGVFIFNYLEGNKLVFDKDEKTLKFTNKEEIKKEVFDIEWCGKEEKYFPRLNEKYLDKNYSIFNYYSIGSYVAAFKTENEARRFIQEYIKRNNAGKKIIKY